MVKGHVLAFETCVSQTEGKNDSLWELSYVVHAKVHVDDIAVLMPSSYF